MSRDTTEIYDVVPVFAVDESGKALITEEQYSWLCNYAVRKAERVQELEEIIEVDGSAFNSLENMYIDLEKQNKRYREYLRRLQRATNRYPAEDMAYVVNKITSEALEGEE